uniref:Uncharacterized protein n=1 Tax=Variovorax paradoxus (strain S110) TaxID=543728 RepID=C5CJN6_VARPS
MKVSIPVRTVSTANAREHWRRVAERARHQRSTARMVFRIAKAEPVLPCTVLLTRVAPRALDDDNLRGALKSVRDGVADWLGIDDRDPRVKWDYGQRKGPVKFYAVDVEVSQ